MLDRETRASIAKALGDAVDSVVRDHYQSLSQEPAITSRIGQNIEARLDDRQIGEYVFRIITQDLPDRGPRSFEKEMGADIFIALSLDGPDGFDKGLLVQTKFDRNISRTELQDQSTRMLRISRSSYVWVYRPQGVSVVSAKEIGLMQRNSLEGLRSRSAEGFFGRVLDCYAGSRRLGIPPVADQRRTALAQRLTDLRTPKGIDVELEYIPKSERWGTVRRRRPQK